MVLKISFVSLYFAWLLFNNLLFQVSVPKSGLDPDWADHTSARRSRASSNTDEDMKIINEADMETSGAAVTVIKRKRGRPKKIIPPEKLLKRKTLSDYTKRKIAETYFHST